MTLSSDWIERHLHDAGGHTGNIYYIRIISRTHSKIWDPTNKVMKAVGDITWDASTILLVEEGLTGVFPIVIAKEMSADTYDIIAYRQLGSTPANSDDVEKQWESKLGGDIHGF